eukprot:Colp12_sorted_trinity150504_noHs@18691
MDLNTPWVINSSDIVMEGKVGSGTFGEVYMAKWKGTRVAVKKIFRNNMQDDRLQMMKAEVGILIGLRHPNIVLFMGVCIEPANMLIVTEYMPKGSLLEILHNKSNKLTWLRKLTMLEDVAKAMHYLHSYEPRIIHRDLKSQNLMVDSDWTVKVSDFGFSRITGNTDQQMTQCGTICWTAPEILTYSKYNHKVDVYSYAVVMWEVLTRKQPYEGLKTMQVAIKVTEGMRPPIPPNTPPSFSALINKCWHQSPDERPDFKDILEDFKVMIEESKNEKSSKSSSEPDKPAGKSSICSIL